MVVADSYYLLRLPSPQTTIVLTVVLPVQVARQTFTLEYPAALGTGAFGAYRQQAVQVTTVGTGDVQISVTWNSAADVDLHLVEPNGNGDLLRQPAVLHRRRARSRLERRVRQRRSTGENIRFPSGRAPTGRYTVRVDHWSSCNASSTNYVVRVINGASSQTFTGTFTGGGDFGGAGSGITITTFTR